MCGRHKGVKTAAMAGRRASDEAVTTTHNRARGPRHNSLRHTPREGLGALSLPTPCQVARSVRSEGRAKTDDEAHSLHMRCVGSHDITYLLAQRGMPVQ